MSISDNFVFLFSLFFFCRIEFPAPNMHTMTLTFFFFRFPLKERYLIFYFFSISRSFQNQIDRPIDLMDLIFSGSIASIRLWHFEIPPICRLRSQDLVCSIFEKMCVCFVRITVDHFSVKLFCISPVCIFFFFDGISLPSLFLWSDVIAFEFSSNR